MPAMKKGIDHRLGLCLAGGGGLGFQHLGLLEALEEIDIRPGLATGTSSGAVMAAFYASGKSPDEIRKILTNFSWSQVVSPVIPLKGILSTKKMEAFFKKAFGDIDITDLPIKLKIAATDLHSGELRAFERGSLVKRLAASCSVPGIFEPVKVDGRSYYDAGGIYNLPLELMSGENLKMIIAGNTIGERGLMKNPRTVREVVYQAYLIRCKTLSEWRTGKRGWEGRKNEKLVLIDYLTEGANPASLKESISMVESARGLSLKALSDALGIPYPVVR
ncbi:MAG: patatin-like phospholipase family protein [bacterium]